MERGTAKESCSTAARDPTSIVGSGHVASLAPSDGRPKPPFRLVEDDTKPTLRDPLLRSDPMETEQAVLILPPFPKPR